MNRPGSHGPGARQAAAHRAPGPATPGARRRRLAAAGAGALASVSLLVAAAVTALPAESGPPPSAPLAAGPWTSPAPVPVPAAHPAEDTADGAADGTATAQDAAAARAQDPAPAGAAPDRIPDQVPVAPATQAPGPDVPAPVRVVVDGSPIDMPVVPVGIEDNGAMTIPDNHVELGWYRHGPAPGSDEGAAVVAGHVDTLTEVTPMARLKDVPVGAEIRVERADGSVQRYRTESVRHIHKESLADADLFRRTGEPVLHLVTCGGEWLEDIGDYEDNVVLRAVPVP
ncbi:sortase domain-containing protein [Kocuria turfanensis]|uniref:sortase domain-containing protein n=1 Tax=Kocuria turfanensis TaxID=388357 RepID=UPI004035C777